MMNAIDFSRSRLTSRIVSYLLRIVVLPTVSLAVMYLVQVHFRDDQTPQRIKVGLFLALIGSLLTMCLGVVAFYAKTWWPGPLDSAQRLYSHWAVGPEPRHSAFSTLLRTPIAKAPHDSATIAFIEGRVAIATPGKELRAPLSGSHCIFHWIHVSQWIEGGINRWEKLLDRRSAASYIVSDESGHVLIEGDDLRQDPLHSCSSDSMKIDLRISTRAATYESRSGVQGLPPAALAYIEAIRQSLPSLDDSRRTRVTEVILQEGDIVTVLGPIEARLVPEGAYRAEHSARTLVMMNPVFINVFLARIDELRWLVTFHRRLFLALIVGILIGVEIVGSGIFLLTQQ